MFFGSRHNLIMPGRGTAWATAGRPAAAAGPGTTGRSCGSDAPGSIRRVEVDTLHFKGNAPGGCSLEVCRAPEADPAELAIRPDLWKPLLAQSKLSPNALHRFDLDRSGADEATHARLNIFPDGGVSRLRLFGVLGARAASGDVRRGV